MGVLVQVRIQLGQGSAAHVASQVIKNEGIGGLYKGLSAGLLRQATYTTARLGTFRSENSSFMSLKMCFSLALQNHSFVISTCALISC